MVAQRVQLALRRGAAAEPRLRQSPVEDDERAVRERQAVRPEQLRHRADGCHGRDERDDEDGLLPCGHDVERAAPHPRLPEERHREVVEGEADREDDQRDPWHASGHVVATSVMPRLWTRTGTENSARSSAGPSRWLSFAQGFRARS